MPEEIYHKKAKRLDGLMGELQQAKEITDVYRRRGQGCSPKYDYQNGCIHTLRQSAQVLLSRRGCAVLVIYGSSQHSKNKVSHRANKNIKRLLHLAAVAVVHKKDGEMKTYYP